MQESFFSNLKVGEFASVLAGPAVGMFFAELGAEVVKIENKPAGGDVTRGWKLPGEDPHAPVSAYFCSVNWGKHHLLLDLDDPADRQTALDLALAADVVISNFKPSAARRLGMDAESLRARNPRLLYAQLNAYPDPADERPAFDVVLQAEAGFLHMCGDPAGPPAKMPVALIDLLAAHQLKEGLLLALLRRERSGHGGVVTVSLFESAVASLANQASNWLVTGHIPQRMGLHHPNIAPYGDLFDCADGQQVLLAVGTERQFQHLCRCLGLERLAHDPAFQTNQARVKHREKLNEQLAVGFRQKNLREWLDLFDRHGVPAARLRDMPAVFELPAAQAMILEENTPGAGRTRRVRTNAFRLD